MQSKFQPMVPAGHAALVFTLEPLWAAFFAWILLSEGWTSRGLGGAALIVVAMLISSLGMFKVKK
jgi:drug/metabolite transporter (DMT)-like permease